MIRRLFLLLAGLALVLASACAEAQSVRIAILGPDEARFADLVNGMRTGMRELGYSEQRLSIIEARIPRGDDRAAQAAAVQLAAQKAAALFVLGSALVKPARSGAPGLPIVFITPGDPVAAGLVESLARPGGNMTALTYEYPELSAKRLELLRELVPRARRVLAIYDGRDASPRQGAAAARAAAGPLGLTFVDRPLGSAEEIPQALNGLGGADALLGLPGGATAAHSRSMIAAANAKSIATVFHTRSPDTHDALLTYGANDVDIARQSARAFDKILRGANAGELPVERPSKLTLVINARVAKAIGVAIPPAFALRADHILE